MMRRLVIAMAFVLMSPQLLAAQQGDVDALLGVSWYGLYMNGQKTGYARTEISKDEEGRVSTSQHTQFQMNMAGTKQDMRIDSVRSYAPDGSLLFTESTVADARGETVFTAVVNGEELTLTIEMNDRKTEQTFPKPQETLADALKSEWWARSNPELGDSISFSLFDPTFQKEVGGTSVIVGIREDILDGVPTKVYEIKTSLDVMGIESVAIVTENGAVLEDVTAGMLTMRLEDEIVAKDVDYSNDVIVSNAAYIDRPIPMPRSRESLRLILRGPLTEHHLFNDERQYMSSVDGHVLFVAQRQSLDGFTPAQLPVEEEEVARWLEPSTYVQSDAPEIVAKAREIAGDETDTLEITKTLCRWVFDAIESTYSARLTNALEVLQSLEGDCTEHSILFVGLARAAGVPAREVAGVIYVNDARPGFYFHQWAKVWVGKWIDVDPTLNQWLADVTHIKLAEGDLFEQVKIIPLVGHLQVEYVPEKAEEPETPAPARHAAPESADTAPDASAADGAQPPDPGDIQENSAS